MGNAIRSAVGASLRSPGKNPFGYYFLNSHFPKVNGYLEENAVKLCKIESHHHVLEIGFGSGIGLKSACKHIKDGSGKIYGIDWSEYVVKCAEKNLADEIAKHQLYVSNDSVMMLPFPDHSFDRVFHTNCFYFWANMELACSEMYRTMKPNSFMVTCMNMERLRQAVEKGFFQDERPDPIVFMHNLELVGFTDVSVKYLICEESGREFAAIFAHVRDKSKDEIEEIEDIAVNELEVEQENREKMLD